jgi:hypothetical protein
MSETKHSPAPWRVSDSHGLCVVNEYGVVADLGPNLVAVPDNSRADATLIASAPEMLRALKDAERELNFIVNTQERRGGLYEQALNKIRAAISKAEGKQ